MKKLLAVSLLAALCLSVASPLLWATESEAEGTGMSGTTQDFSDIEKTLKQDRMDNLEKRVADLEQSNRYLTDRVRDVERTMYDFRSRQ